MKRLIKKTIIYTLIPDIEEYMIEEYNEAHDYMTPAEKAEVDDDIDEYIVDHKIELERNGSISFRNGVWWGRTAVHKYEEV